MARIRGDGNSNFLKGTKKADKISGLGGDDFIDGGKGDDVIRGGGGNDNLFGGKGDDSVYGGSGRDTFAYHVGFSQIDRFLDFKDGEDKIAIFSDGGTIGFDDLNITQVGANTVITFDDDPTGGQIIIKDFTAANLTAADIDFFPAP